MATEQLATEDAAFENVFASDRDRGGKSAPSSAPAPVDANAGLAPPAETAAPAPSEPAAQPEEVDEAQLHPVPRGILKKERERFRAKLDEEARARVAAETEAKLYREQMARLEQQRVNQPVPQQHQQPRQQIRVPDPILEPEHFAAFQESKFAYQLHVERLNYSEDRAREKHGEALVDQALEAAQKAGLVQQNYFNQVNPRHPWGALVDWYKREQTIAKVGTDPEAYEKQVEERIRQKVLEELKAGKVAAPNAGAVQPAGNVTRFPGTLADATATGQQGAFLTEEAAMNSVFASGRRRK